MSVSYSAEEGIAIITIDRPEQRNAVNRAVRDGLFEAWNRFEADDSAGVAILTGAGDAAFCAGMDLKEAAQLGLRVPPRDFLPVPGENVRVSKPTIAAVQGAAVAAGWLLAQSCDLCVAAEGALFSITEAKFSRGTPWATPLIHMLPQRVMMEVLLTGRPLTAQRLFALGYVNSVVPAAELLAAARDLAQTILANAPLTVRACRRLVYLSTEMSRSSARAAADELFRPVYLSNDALEGPRSFAEKRPPRWSAT